MKTRINGNGLRLIFAILITLAFFLFLPITYFVSRNKARNLFMLEKNRKRNIKTVFLQKKQRKQRKKIVLKKISRPRLMKRNELRKRFKLDLSIAMGGAGSLVKVDARNIIYMENQVDVPPVRKRFFMPRYPIQARVENIERIKRKAIITISKACGEHPTSNNRHLKLHWVLLKRRAIWPEISCD